MEFQYALGLVGLFLGVILLITGIYYGLVEPIRKRRLINQRIRGNKREQEVRAQVFKAFQETKESVVLNLAERYFGWGKVDNLQRPIAPGGYLPVSAHLYLYRHPPGRVGLYDRVAGGKLDLVPGFIFPPGDASPHVPAVEAEAEDPEDRALHARRHGVAGQVSEGRPHLVRNPGPGESGDPRLPSGPRCG